MSLRSLKTIVSGILWSGLAVALTGIGGVALASSGPGSAGPENPYLELYAIRIAEAEITLEREQALSVLQNKKYQRTRALLERNAVAPEDYDISLADAEVAAADAALAQKKVDEAKAYYKIVAPLATGGGKIPLCTYAE